MFLETVSFVVDPVYVKEGNTRLGTWILRRFQEKVYDTVTSRKNGILVAPTGAGKTLSLLLGEEGFVGLYPNNTLLLDQQRSIDKILKEALGAKSKPIYRANDVDVLRVYDLPNTRGELPIVNHTRVAVVLLSGRYIAYEYDEEGKLLPKRMIILRRIVNEICYPSKGEKPPYIIVLATPDTVSLIMAGIYRDFEKVGYTVHDAILAAQEGINIDYVLSKYGVATVGELGDLSEIRQCLLKYPWFIDEFHLYGDYEASQLIPLLKIYRDYVGWEEPVVFSSATPEGYLYKEVINEFKPRIIHASTSAESGALVRGETEVEVLRVKITGRGISRWFKLGFAVPDIVKVKISDIVEVAVNGGNVFIVVDRVNQVPPIVDILRKHMIEPECAVSIKPEGCSEEERNVIVGSESISQGIDRRNVRYGILTAYNSMSLLQRFGRIGRGVNSRVVLVIPDVRDVDVLKMNGRKVDYNDFVEAIKNTYPDVRLAEKGKSKKVKELLTKRSELVELTTAIAFAHVSKPKGVMSIVSKRLKERIDLLNFIYGPPETIADVLRFRSSGFTVMIEKPNSGLEETDIGTVLRNYVVEDVKKLLIRHDELSKTVVAIKISFKPGRYIMVARQISERAREDLIEILDGKVTTIGELAELGYDFRISSLDGSVSFEIPLTVDVKSQTLAILKVPKELKDYYVYTVQGVEIHSGEGSLLGLFL